MSGAVRFLRVIGIGATHNRPQVLATVDGIFVRWDRRGWDCRCGDDTCGHVDAVADLLDPRVTGEEQP